MRRRYVALAFGVAALGIAAWQLLRSLDADPPLEAAAIAQPSRLRPNEAARSPIEPPASSLATVRGTVRDEAGAPIGNARVCGSLELCTSTSVTGEYVLTELPTTTARIAAAAPKFQPRLAWISGLTTGETRSIDLVLASGGVRVHGRVLDPRREPLAGATVTTAIVEGVAATTTADGRFELWVAPGPLRLVARAAGHASSTRRVAPPAEIDFALEPESTIAGIVVDASAAPVAGVRVELEETDAAPRQRVVTADDGTFRLVGIPSGSYELRAESFGLAGRTVASVGLGEQLTNVVIRVGEAFQVGVSVKHADGSSCVDGTASLVDRDARRAGPVGISRPQPGGTVIDAVPAGVYQVAFACPPGTSTDTLDVKGDIDVAFTMPVQPATGTLRVTVEAPGRVAGEGDGLFLAYRSERRGGRNVTVPGNHVVVEALPPGAYAIRLTSTSVEGDEHTVTIDAGKTTEKVLRIPPPTLGRLRATAVDAEGRTLSDVALRITGRQVERAARTTDDGSATLYLPAGDYEVAHGSTSVRAQVQNGASRDVRLTVAPVAIVRGFVVDRANRPVTDAFVARLNPQLASGLARVDSRPVDASGAFQLAMTSDAPIMVVAIRVGGGESSPVKADGSAPVTLVIGDGATLTGRVITGAGAPVTSFIVAVSDVTRNLHLGERSFSGGAFTWSNLSAGEYRVLVEAGPLAARGTLTIAAGARTASLELALPRVFTLVGRVVDAVSREPIANAKVLITSDFDDSSHGLSNGSLQVARATDADGRFTYDGAIAASYQVTVTTDAEHLDASQRVEVRDANVELGEIAVARARR